MAALLFIPSVSKSGPDEGREKSVFAQRQAERSDDVLVFVIVQS